MRRFPLILALTAWLFATGSHWDLLQTFAWARMFAGYLQTDSVPQALASTFDADKPCPLCKAVASAKQKQETEGTATTSGLKKILLVVPASGSPTILSCESPSWTRHNVRTPLTDLPAPATPPPRLGRV